MRAACPAEAMIAMTQSSKFLLLWIVSCSAAAQEPPQALRKLFEHRETLKTGVVEFSRQRHRFFDWETYYTGRFAADDNILINRGGSDGVLLRAADGTASPLQNGPRITLKKDGQAWVYSSDGISGRLYDESVAENFPTLRTMGVSSMPSHRDLRKTLWRDRAKGLDARRFSERIEDGLYVVTAESDVDIVTWWIDPKRGWSAVRVTSEQDGELVLESRTELKKFDGVWFPETVLYFNKSYKDGKEPIETVKVLKARFNKPNFPSRFTPNDIGIETGMMLEHSRSDGTTDLVVWDGSRALSQKEYLKRRRAGEVTASAALQRTRAKRAADRLRSERTGERIWNAPGFQRIWAQYTRRFIAKFKLDAEQTQKALTVLADCQEQAERHLRKSGFEKLQKRLDALASETKPDPKEARALSLRRWELMKPVDKIFEKQLKPRLDRLPTRAQREQAEAVAKAKEKKP